MRIMMADVWRGRIAAVLAAGLLTVGTAQVALATASAPTVNSAPAKPAPDDVVEDENGGGDEGEPPARGVQPGHATAGALTHDDVVDATRVGLRRSAIGSGIRWLRILDYVLLAGVGVLLLLVIASLVLLLSLRARLATLGGAAGPGARDLAHEEERLYGTKPLP